MYKIILSILFLLSTSSIVSAIPTGKNMPDRVKGDMYVSGNITSSASVNSKDNFFRKIQKKQNTKIVCFGDSITFGYTAGNIQSAYPYPKKLQDIFSAVYNSTTTTVVNAGVSGDTTANALARIQTDVIAQAPDICIVMFGTNDVLQDPGVSVDTYKANMQTIIETLNNAGISVIVMASPPLVTNNSAAANGQIKISLYRSALKDLCRQRNVPIIDMNEKFLEVTKNNYKDLTEMFPDQIHPTIEFYPLIADFVFQDMFLKLPTTNDYFYPFAYSPYTVNSLGLSSFSFLLSSAGLTDPLYPLYNTALSTNYLGSMVTCFFS